MTTIPQFTALNQQELLRAYRSDVIEYFTQQGFIALEKTEQTPEYHQITEAIVYRWILLQSQLIEVPVSISECDVIVKQILNKLQDVMVFPGHTLTVGDLKKRMNNLPDNTPILYQRIEDSYFSAKNGWMAYPFVWSKDEVNDIQIQWHKDNPSPHTQIEEHDGKMYAVFYSDYIPAFSCYSTKEKDGKIALLIHAHY